MPRKIGYQKIYGPCPIYKCVPKINYCLKCNIFIKLTLDCNQLLLGITNTHNFCLFNSTFERLA